MKNNDWRLATEGYFERGTDRATGTDYVRDIDFELVSMMDDRASDRSAARQVTQVPGLPRERVEEIRRRMEDGTYVSEAMAEQVARTLIARGELRR